MAGSPVHGLTATTRIHGVDDRLHRREWPTVVASSLSRSPTPTPGRSRRERTQDARCDRPATSSGHRHLMTEGEAQRVGMVVDEVPPRRRCRADRTSFGGAASMAVQAADTSRPARHQRLDQVGRMITHVTERVEWARCSDTHRSGSPQAGLRVATSGQIVDLGVLQTNTPVRPDVVPDVWNVVVASEAGKRWAQVLKQGGGDRWDVGPVRHAHRPTEAVILGVVRALPSVQLRARSLRSRHRSG